MKRGAFILLEGLDRSGKSTHVKRLTHHLSQLLPNGAITISFPDRTSNTGKKCDEYLRMTTSYDDEVIHHLFSENRHEAAKMIRDTLNSGVSIVCDRYSYSGIAFTAMKDPKFSIEWCFDFEKGLPMPDVVVFLDINPEAAEKRGGYGKEIYEKKEVQAKVRIIFNELMNRSNKLHASDLSLAPVWNKIDTDNEHSVVEKLVFNAVEPFIKDLLPENTDNQYQLQPLREFRVI